MSQNSSPRSFDSDKSYVSTLSDDSYLEQLKPGLDDQFKEMLNHIRMIENSKTIVEERKRQSHNAKKSNGLVQTPEWTGIMRADYAQYKAKVDELAAAKKKSSASDMRAKRSKNQALAEQEKARATALEDSRLWFDAAIVAAKARLSFMTKHPNAYDSGSTQRHIKAAEDVMKSAKHAKRQIEVQKQKIAEAKIAADRY
ncbi:hypothetical protein F4808DRAFT_455448 [Astrocystis sublimbata]|nr:hypothetical protein F4808DRAFT_455448 [Astrocystis sublimbata]